MMQNIIKQKYWILATFLFFLLVSYAFIIFPEKVDFSIWLIEARNKKLDLFFQWITFLGDGWFIIPLGLVILWKNRTLGSLILSAYIFSGLIAQIIKRSINATRPAKDPIIIDLLESLSIPLETLAKYKSFPSGHTTSAFAVALILLMNLKKFNGKLSIILLAISVGISRIYLVEHYFEDVFFGAILGCICAFSVQGAKSWFETKWNVKQ